MKTVIAAVLAAAAAFALPALDASLPGGSIVWQLAALAFAAVAALWGWRATRAAGGLPLGQRRLGRVLAALALLLVLAWAGGVAFLWLVWPR